MDSSSSSSKSKKKRVRRGANKRIPVSDEKSDQEFYEKQIRSLIYKNETLSKDLDLAHQTIHHQDKLLCFFQRRLYSQPLETLLLEQANSVLSGRPPKRPLRMHSYNAPELTTSASVRYGQQMEDREFRSGTSFEDINAPSSSRQTIDQAAIIADINENGNPQIPQPVREKLATKLVAMRAKIEEISDAYRDVTTAVSSAYRPTYVTRPFSAASSDYSASVGGRSESHDEIQNGSVSYDSSPENDSSVLSEDDSLIVHQADSSVHQADSSIPPQDEGSALLEENSSVMRQKDASI